MISQQTQLPSVIPILIFCEKPETMNAQRDQRAAETTWITSYLQMNEVMFFDFHLHSPLSVLCAFPHRATVADKRQLIENWSEGIPYIHNPMNSHLVTAIWRRNSLYVTMVASGDEGYCSTHYCIILLQYTYIYIYIF